jgi:hypothetical protein
MSYAEVTFLCFFADTGKELALGYGGNVLSSRTKLRGINTVGACSRHLCKIREWGRPMCESGPTIVLAFWLLAPQIL